jgi:hypothetical protein
MAQTSYQTNMDIAFAGLKADSGIQDVVEGTNVDAGPIPFGALVEPGPNADEVILMATPANVSGIHLHSHAFDKPNELNGVGVLPEGALSILKSGRIYVPISTDVAVGDDVWMAPDGTDFANADGGGYLQVVNAGVKWARNGASADKFGILKIDL